MHKTEIEAFYFLATTVPPFVRPNGAESGFTKMPRNEIRCCRGEVRLSERQFCHSPKAIPIIEIKNVVLAWYVCQLVIKNATEQKNYFCLRVRSLLSVGLHCTAVVPLKWWNSGSMLCRATELFICKLAFDLEMFIHGMGGCYQNPFWNRWW